MPTMHDSGGGTNVERLCYQMIQMEPPASAPNVSNCAMTVVLMDHKPEPPQRKSVTGRVIDRIIGLWKCLPMGWQVNYIEK